MTEAFQGLFASGDGQRHATVPVWRNIVIQLAMIIALCLLFLVLSETLSLKPESDVSRVLTAALLLFVPVVWLAIAVAPETQSARPRRRLFGVAVLSALSAAAIGLPLVQDFFRLEEWLPLETVFRRILGFALTAGLVDAGLKLLVLRFTIYPDELRMRSDAVAYCLASAVGYSFYLNIAIVWQLQPSLAIAANYVLANLAIQFASAMFIALGITESYFGNAMPLVLPTNVIAAAATTGLIAPVFTGIMSGPLGTAGNEDRPLFGILFLIAAICVAGGVTFFLYNASERREREAFASSRDSDGI
ncbi:MAG: hypothetical protein OXI40_10795 [Chloroflexota bacterium]|nr:hypothetical protein [Chloroflexota bacterium]